MDVALTLVRLSQLRLGVMPLFEASIGCMCLVDIIWAHEVGLTVHNLEQVVGQVAMLAGLAAIYLWFRPNMRLAEMARYVGLWACFSTAAAVLTYLCASTDFPLRDAFFVQCDQALGFDFNGWTRLLLANPIAYKVLELDYNSLLPQIALTVFWLAHTCTRGRNAAFPSAAMLSLVLASMVAAVLPALGPTQALNPALSGPPAYVGEILAMRSHAPVTRSLAELQGIICFPSYHTVLAILLIWAHRGLASFWPIAVINGVMLLSVPSVGNHYLFDMLGGAAVALVSLAATGQVRGLMPSLLRPARPQEIPIG